MLKLKKKEIVRAPFPPIGGKARMGADHNATTALTPTLSQNWERGSSTGFSLVESLVIISIISILTAMSAAAVPAIRAHQELVADTENIRALLLDAKERTLNQVRPEDCLQGAGSDQADATRAACSDVGIAFVNGEIIEFAHTTLIQPPKYDSHDYSIVKSKLASSIETGSTTSLLFVGVPPSAFLYKDGLPLSGGNDFARITLRASDGSKRTIRVYSFGTIEVEL